MRTRMDIAALLERWSVTGDDAVRSENEKIVADAAKQVAIKRRKHLRSPSNPAPDRGGQLQSSSLRHVA